MDAKLKLHMEPAAPWCMWGLSFPIRDLTCTLCLGAWSLNPWTTRNKKKFINTPCHPSQRSTIVNTSVSVL
ncbi:hypothetical protein CapIbe_023854 [Capra ibex]